MLERAMRALRADPELFETVEHDAGYTGEAGIIVAITSVLGGLGAMFAGGGLSGLIGGIIAGFISWLVWAGLTYFVGVRLFGGTADLGEMLRVTGFAHVPLILTIIPIIGFFALLWALWVAVVALRQGLDITTGKAVGVAVVGWIVLVVLRSLFFFL